LSKKDLEFLDSESFEEGFMPKLEGGEWTASPGVKLKEKLANHILQKSDAGYLIQMNSLSSNSVTVPPDSSVAFEPGTKIEIMQINSGETQIIAGSGVSLNYSIGTKISGQWGLATLIKRSADSWILSGNLKT
jgi:hypothetical protein